MLKYGSLFSGIGGFDLGLDRSGMTCMWQCEIEPNPVRVLEKHWPDVTRYEDVTKLDGKSAERVDLICGGFPCQDLSVAGKRAGLAGERSGLFFEFMRVVDEQAPAWVLIENVPGLLSSNNGRDMGVVLRELGKLGYGWAYRVLDAQWFGVAQRRRRVFIVGCLGGTASAAKVLFESESLPWDSKPSREKGERIADSSQEGTDFDSDTVGALRARDCKGAGFDEAYENKLIMARESGQGYWMEDEISGTLRSEGENRPSRPSNVVCFQQNTRDEVRKVNGDGDLAGALAAEPGAKQQNYLACGIFNDATPKIGEEVSPTLRSREDGGGFDQSVSKGAIVRRLTPLECERLQGFPDGWTEGLSDTARYKVLGNAVAVPVVEWIGERIVKVWKQTSPDVSERSE